MAIGADTEQAEAVATLVLLAHAFVDLLERVANVGEAVVPAGDGGVTELERQLLELPEHVAEAIGFDGVIALPRRGDWRKTDFVKPDLLEQVAIDHNHVEVLPRQRHASAD